MKAIALLALAYLMPLYAADPSTPVYWSAAQLKNADQNAAAKVRADTHLGSQRLLDSAFVLYRNGPSQAEIHEQLADFIVVRDGEGTVLVGGKIIDGKSSGPGEQRGKSIEGGTKYPLAAGDTLYVPANTVHQFLVEPGKHFTATIIKITPKP